MPVSSKKIIEHIELYKTPFTDSEISSRLISASKSRKKKDRGSSKKDTAKVSDTIFALARAGFLRKNRKSYTLIKLTLSGTIKINSTGNAVLENDTGYDIVVRKEDAGHANNNDTVIVKIFDYRRGVFSGKIIKVEKRGRSVFAARVLKKTPGSVIYKIMDSPGNPEAASERFDKEPELGQSVMISMEDGLISNRRACRVTRIFSLEDEESDIERIIVKHSLPGPHTFHGSRESLQESISPDEMKKRKDYRNLFTITIDGEDAKDFDDAISLEVMNNTYKLYVHIADVSAYVRRGSILDAEAYVRGTSYYLGNHVIPMLPEVLSNELCSLRPGEERLTMTAEITIDGKGEYTGYEFHRGVIISDKRLTYKNSAETIESRQPEDLYKRLADMFTLASTLKAKRMGTGRIDLNLSDVKLIYEAGGISDIGIDERLKSHMIIEEFMLTANEVVSRELKDRGVPGLYRIHEEMRDESLNALSAFLKLFNIKLKKSGNVGRSIQDVLDKIRGLESEQVINLVVLKSLMQAYYGSDPLGHFGLGFEDYTHFTSPIRRYPDLIVHRCLKSLIDGSQFPYTPAELSAIGEKSSELERVAQKAERDLVKIKSCRLLKDRTSEIFDAIISGIARAGFFVTLSEMPVEGMVPLKNLTDDFYIVRDDAFTITGRKYGKRFRLGDKLQVRLSDVDIENMRIDFDLP